MKGHNLNIYISKSGMRYCGVCEDHSPILSISSPEPQGPINPVQRGLQLCQDSTVRLRKVMLLVQKEKFNVYLFKYSLLLQLESNVFNIF